MKMIYNKIHDGVVIKKNNGQYWVWVEEQAMRCTVKLPPFNPSQRWGKEKTRLRSRDESENKIMVGEHVGVILKPNDCPVIVEVFERSNLLARRAAQPMPGSHASQQVIAVNIDQVVSVMALSQPAPRWNLLDRYLASTESLEIKGLICLSKVDAARNANGKLNEEIMEEIETYQKIGYQVVLTSALTGEGLPELKQLLCGQVSVLLGKSGAGKSSLLNVLQPGLGLRVGEINPTTGKGRHTTTGVEMHACDFGGWLVDTPGTREFGLWDIDSDDMAWFFPEMRPWLGQCRFGLACQHDEEPGCAIRQAVMNGQISPRRYFSMMKLKEEGYFQ